MHYANARKQQQQQLYEIKNASMHSPIHWNDKLQAGNGESFFLYLCIAFLLISKSRGVFLSEFIRLYIYTSCDRDRNKQNINILDRLLGQYPLRMLLFKVKPHLIRYILRDCMYDNTRHYSDFGRFLLWWYALFT